MPRVLADVPVLVVEDHSASARMIAALLGAAGAEVRTAETAEQALALLEVFQPRALIVDILLPGVDGLELVSRLKADDKSRGIVCIAVTVINGRDLEQAARDVGCAAFIRKPINTDTFATLVAEHIEGMK